MEDNSIKNIVPSQNDLNKIIESITSNNSLATTVIRSTVSAITRISSIIANADIDKSIKNFSKLDKSLLQYNKVVSSVITSICEKHDNKNLVELLGRQDTKDTEGNIKTTYTTIEAAQQIPNLINNAFKVLDAFNKDGYGFGAAIRMQKNLKLFKKVIGTVLKDMISMFNEINLQYGDSLLKTLVKQPDIIEAYSEKEYDTSNKDNTNNLKKQIENTKTTQGQLGLLDIVTQAFALFGAIAGLNPPRFGKFKKKLNLAMSQLQYSFDKIFNFAIENNSKFSSINEFCKSFTSENGITDLIMSLKMATNQIISTFTRKTKRNLKRSLTGIVAFSEVLSSLDINVINNNALNAMSSKNVGEMLRNSKTNIQKIEEISIALLSFTKNIIKLKRRKRRFKRGLNVLVSMITSINDKLKELTSKETELSDETIDTILNRLESVNNILTSITTVSKNIRKIGFFAIPTLISILLVKLLIFSLKVTIKSIVEFSKILSKKETDKTLIGLTNFDVIIKKVRNISFNVILLGLMALPVLISIVLISVLMVSLIGISFILRLGGKVISMLAKQAVPDFTKFGISMLVIVGVIVAVGLLLFILANIKDKIIDGFIAAILVVGFVVIFMLATAALGFVLQYMLPFMVPTILALGMVVLTIGLIIGIANMLKTLSDLNFDDKFKTLVISSCTNIFSTIKEIFTLSKEYMDKDTRKQARNSKKTIRQIKKIVSFITNIANNLKIIQDLKLDYSKISTNIKTIFDTISDLEQKIIAFNTEGKESKEKEDNIITAIKNARKQKKLFRTNKKTFNKSEKLLVEINEIAEQLDFLSKFKIDDDKKSLITTNIQNIFKVIDYLQSQLFENNKALTKREVGKEVKQLRRQKRLINNNTENLTKTTALIQGIGDILDVLDILGDEKQFKLDDAKKTTITNNVTKIITLLNDITAQVLSNNTKSSKKDIKSFSKVANVIKTLAGTFETISKANVSAIDKNLSSYSGFVDKINTVDVTKLETSTRMFEQMANFSKNIQGDFNKLAETLNENLMPVLEELKNIMGQIPEKLDVGFQNTSASIAATTTTQTASTVAAQVNRESPNMSKEQQNAEVQRRLNAYNAAEANGMISKIDEMLNLLKGYSGYVKVKTV